MVEAEKLSAPGSFSRRSQVFPSTTGVGEPLRPGYNGLCLPYLCLWRSRTSAQFVDVETLQSDWPPHPNLKPLLMLFPVPERPCPPC